MRHYINSGGICPLLQLTSIGSAKNPRVTRFGPGRRNVYIVHYVVSGKGCFNGQPVGAGQGFLAYPGQPEEYHPDEQDPWEFLWVASEDPRMADLFALYNAHPETHIFTYDYVDRVRTLMQEVYRNKEVVRDAFYVLELYFSIFPHHTKSNQWESRRSSPATYAELAAGHIRANLYAPPTVLELTRMLGISQPYLYRIFRKRFGLSPKQYINHCRLEQAKKLLSQPDMSVTQVATSVGFEDVLAFSRFFSGSTGRSPQQFRREIKPE